MPLARRLVDRLVRAIRPWVERARAIPPATDLAESIRASGAGSCINYSMATICGTRIDHHRSQRGSLPRAHGNASLDVGILDSYLKRT